MAADQRRKRVNGSSIAGYGPREQHRTKRKNPGPVQNALHMRSHISVEWDDNQKRVVAKREQIGISWRQMKPFANYVSNDHKILADVFTVPREIFDLDNLSEVLSYEVWKTHLSEKEKSLLMQFLPDHTEVDQAMEELLAGINFHFGNPVFKWGSSLCSGDLHPDMVVDKEQHLKSEKRAYCSQLHNYHNNMIGFLSTLKEMWQSSKDTEKEFVPNMWRQTRVERRIPSNVNQSRAYDHDENVTMSSEPCSSDAEEKARTSDNQISSLRKDVKLNTRVLEKGIVKGKSRSLISSDDMHFLGEKAKKGDKLPKRNIHFIDSDKYMSCIKISKQQHQLVKSMKKSGKSIESKSLNRVLGNLSNIHVQSYKVFVKEEQKKLNEHWSQLVNKDLPVAYANWKQIQIQRHSMKNSLVEELKDKSNPSLEEEEEEDNVSSGSELQDHDKESMSSGSEFKDQNDDNVSSGDELLDRNEDNVKSESGLQDKDEDNISSENEVEDGGLNEQSNMKDHEDSVGRALENQSSHNSFVSCDEDFNQAEEDSESNPVLSKSDDASLRKDEYSRNMNTLDKDEYSRNINTQDVSIDEVEPFASGSDIWQTAELPHSYYDSARNHEYTASGLSLTNSHVNEDPRNHVIDLEAELHQEETGKELFHRHSDDGTFSYQSQDRSALLSSLFEGEGLLPYPQEQKGAGLDFQTSNNVMVGDDQCSSHFKEPLQMSLTLEQGQRRSTEVYMPESMSDNIYSNAGRYLIPRQEPFIPRQEPFIPRQEPFIPRQDSLASVNVTDWATNTAPITVSSQSHMNAANFVGHHWPPADHQVCGGWSGSYGSGLSSQSVRTGENTDQSLFSILSHCNQLRSGSSYDSVRNNTDQFVEPRTYGVLDAAGMPRANAVVPQVPRAFASVPQASLPLDYLIGCEAPSSIVPDDMTWMNMPHQNSGLHDQMGKPYLRSWNR